jgi:hypothetical protein
MVLAQTLQFPVSSTKIQATIQTFCPNCLYPSSPCFGQLRVRLGISFFNTSEINRKFVMRPFIPDIQPLTGTKAPSACMNSRNRPQPARKIAVRSDKVAMHSSRLSLVVGPLI